jgi:hypothetical protein
MLISAKPTACVTVLRELGAGIFNCANAVAHTKKARVKENKRFILDNGIMKKLCKVEGFFRKKYGIRSI